MISFEFHFQTLLLRPVNAKDAAMLIAIGQTIATEFSTIAAAINYWK
ncbi:MAG: hexameric tyrosine-coordinated heme protein [Gelidibacter sp.]